MLGIHPKKRNIIRPLLFARKDEIYDFLKENKIECSKYDGPLKDPKKNINYFFDYILCKIKLIFIF